jgi:DNA-binding FadR family transcriptional regulator
VRVLGLRIPDATSRVLRRHGRILGAVRAGDPAAARTAMGAHIDEARETCTRRSKGPEPGPGHARE